MSMLHVLFSVLGAAGATVTLSGHTNTANNNSDVSASFKIRSNGNMYESDNAGVDQQIDDATDWVRPTTAASDYEWRWTNATGDTGSVTATAAEDAWVETDLEVTVEDTTTVGGANSVTFDFEVRHKSTLDVVSGSYTLTAEKTT